MSRRILLSVSLVACAAAVMFASSERGTFILTNGERISGTMVFHGSNAFNLIDGFLNIGNSDGTERTIRIGEVAVIDFVGGTPSNNELAALPANGHFLAMRDGTTRRGRFGNIVSGVTVQWIEESGDERGYAISQVSRVYLNLQSARNTFGYTGAAGAGGGLGQGRGRGRGRGLPEGTVAVQANTAWNDSGLDVRRGDLVSFRATGEVDINTRERATSGPDGRASVRNREFPLPNSPGGQLIGKVGNRPAFAIGSNTEPIVMPANGRLMLGVNDSAFGDNGGSFTVTMVRR